MRKRIIAAVLALTVLCTGALADFNDVPGDAWYAEAVSWAQENGIMDGVAEGVFEPDGAVTRAMFVTMLYRLAGEPETERWRHIPTRRLCRRLVRRSRVLGEQRGRHPGHRGYALRTPTGT